MMCSCLCAASRLVCQITFQSAILSSMLFAATDMWSHHSANCPGWTADAAGGTWGQALRCIRQQLWDLQMLVLP